MIKRERAEGLLKRSEQVYGDSFLIVDKGELADLCRTWLAVDGAESFTVVESGWNDDGYAFDGRIFHLPTDLIGQRVKLVPEADSGGDRG